MRKHGKGFTPMKTIYEKYESGSEGENNQEINKTMRELEVCMSAANAIHKQFFSGRINTAFPLKPVKRLNLAYLKIHDQYSKVEKLQEKLSNLLNEKIYKSGAKFTSFKKLNAENAKMRENYAEKTLNDIDSLLRDLKAKRLEFTPTAIKHENASVMRKTNNKPRRP